MRALTWTPESMPDPWVEFEGASSLSSFKCELRVVIGGRKEARRRGNRDYVPHARTPLALLHATPRRLLLGGTGCILNSTSSITRPSATDLNRIYSGFVFLSPAPPTPDTQVTATSSHPRDPFLLRTPRPALADVLHDSAHSTRMTRTSSLSCVRRRRRPHVHCFYCTCPPSLIPPGLSLRLWCKPASPRPAPHAQYM
ncbi:hypothetical protein B0H13DRAFT_2370068 [Mycena leptocephala]|nr:hypothetical protein B0H13DRAFT_2370068 [Mycena leptocephala]